METKDSWIRSELWCWKNAANGHASSPFGAESNSVGFSFFFFFVSVSQSPQLRRLRQVLFFLQRTLSIRNSNITYYCVPPTFQVLQIRQRQYVQRRAESSCRRGARKIRNVHSPRRHSTVNSDSVVLLSCTALCTHYNRFSLQRKWSPALNQEKKNSSNKTDVTLCQDETETRTFKSKSTLKLLKLKRGKNPYQTIMSSRRSQSRRRYPDTEPQPQTVGAQRIPQKQLQASAEKEI